MNKDLANVIEEIEKMGQYEFEMKVENPEDPEMDVLPIQLFSKEEIEDAQLGYRVDDEGNSLISSAEGDWKESWYVIGSDEELGDPLFVDTSNKNYPVLTAMHGEGEWEPQVISPSLCEFLDSLS